MRFKYVEEELATLCLLGHPERPLNTCPTTLSTLLLLSKSCAINSEGVVSVSIWLPVTSAVTRTGKVLKPSLMIVWILCNPRQGSDWCIMMPNFSEI